MMRNPRLPPLDTSGYISCPIDTPLIDFDHKSPLPCIIVTPSTPTEYHIAFHHKSSPLKPTGSFAAQQDQQQAGPRRRFFAALNILVDTPLPASGALFEWPVRRLPFKARYRTALMLAIPIFIIVCHILLSPLMRTVGLGGTLFERGVSRGGFSSAATHMRAQRESHPGPLPDLVPAHGPVIQDNPLGQPVTLALD